MPRVNPEILVWARETAGLTLEEATGKLSIKTARGVPGPDRLAALEAGENEPTRPMLLKMAKQYHRPLLVFYLSSAPRKGHRGEDFRSLPDAMRSLTSDALLDALLRDIRVRQSMVREVLEDEEEPSPLAFVGSATIEDGVAPVSQSISKTIGFELGEFRAKKSAAEAFGVLRARVEAAGVFVLLIGNLGTHHTELEVRTFRGFALADNIAPFVVINDQDAKAAWAFTLLHELAHIWLGQTGVSGVTAELAAERFCNDVASELLLPTKEAFQVPIAGAASFAELKDLITRFADAKNLSRSMVAYKLLRMNRIDQRTWDTLSKKFREEWLQTRRQQRAQDRERDSGPNYYTVRQHRLGPALVAVVQRMMAAGALTTSKAGKVLGVKPCNVAALVGIGGHG